MESKTNDILPLIGETFSTMESLMPGKAAEIKEKASKIFLLLGNRFDEQFCHEAVAITHAAYKILPNRSRELLKKHILTFFGARLNPGEADQILDIIVFNIESAPAEDDALALQIQASMGIQADNAATDEVAGATGRFGYDITNPIPVNGIDMIDDYFSTLRLINGELFSYTRKGSVKADSLPFPVDRYEIYNSESMAIATLYVYAYHAAMTGKVPDGFRKTGL